MHGWPWKSLCLCYPAPDAIFTEEYPDMPAIVGVRFKRGGRIHFFDPANLDLAVGDRVVLETADGTREGSVAIAPSQVLHSDLRGPLDPVLRKADGC